MKKFALVLLLLVLVCGCSSEKSGKLTGAEQKLIAKLEEEYNGYKCDDMYCGKKEVYDNREYWYHIYFNKNEYEFIYNEIVTIDENEIRMTESYVYNWGIDYLEAEAKIVAKNNVPLSIAIDEKGDFVCSSNDTNSCLSLKNKLIRSKLDFLKIVSQADMTLEDIR